MSLPWLVHEKSRRSRLVWGDTMQPAKDKEVVGRIELPQGVNIDTVIEENMPSLKEIPEGGYELALHKIYETRVTNGEKSQVQILCYIAARR